MVKLDVGCGHDKEKGYVGIDKIHGSDIQHDLTIFPYPLEDNSCEDIRMHLVWGCIEPKYRIQLMNELWRIASKDCKLEITETHDLSNLRLHDPIYYSGANEITFLYFFPGHPKYDVYKPRPWSITKYYHNFVDIVNVHMYPIKEKKK